MCARNSLYDGRVQGALALIENERLERQINAALSPSPDEPTQPSASSPKVKAEAWMSERTAALDKTSQIIAQADRLKAEVDAARKEIEARKEAIRRRRSDLGSVAKGIPERREKQLAESRRSIILTRYKWKRCADTTAKTRAFLCEEAARLYGLRQVRKGNSRRLEMGGVSIIDLHSLNNLAPEVISTSLAHVAHILTLTSHYLAIRLPAEITLPHRDYPRPTMFSISSSYRHGEIPFPGSAFPTGQVPSGAQTGGFQPSPRPRPLFVDKPLPTLAREDPAGHTLFLEGVALLAYDVAWACCSQGVTPGDRESYEDVCNLGQNLWRLLIGDQLHRRSAEPAFPASLTPPSGSPRGEPPDDVGMRKPQMGQWSHGTTHTFLGGAEGTELIRTFRLLNPAKLVDQLKKRLSSEAPMLEWEKIDGDEVQSAEGELDDGVLVRNRRAGTRPERRDLGAESVMTVRTAGSSVLEDGGDGTPTGREGGEGNRASGTNGWTRLKHRQN